MQTIARKSYLQKFSVLKEKNIIKVATGVRRCRKSTLKTPISSIKYFDK